MIKRKAIMLLCSLMYRFAGEVKGIYFYGCNWPGACCLEDVLGDYFIPHADTVYKAGKETDQITANISGHAVTSSVCRRQYAAFT